VELAAVDRIQRMIDEEAAERFPQGAVPRLARVRAKLSERARELDDLKARF
jgi:hypothetical protein